MSNLSISGTKRLL